METLIVVLTGDGSSTNPIPRTRKTQDGYDPSNERGGGIKGISNSQNDDIRIREGALTDGTLVEYQTQTKLLNPLTSLSDLLFESTVGASQDPPSSHCHPHLALRLS